MEKEFENKVVKGRQEVEILNKVLKDMDPSMICIGDWWHVQLYMIARHVRGFEPHP